VRWPLEPQTGTTAFWHLSLISEAKQLGGKNEWRRGTGQWAFNSKFPSPKMFFLAFSFKNTHFGAEIS